MAFKPKRRKTEQFGHSSHKITEQCEGGYELRLFGGLINRKMNLPWLSSSPNYGASGLILSSISDAVADLDLFLSKVLRCLSLPFAICQKSCMH